MTDLRAVIAKNICDLRTEAGMTQAKLAEVLNYSDKAVSKWERAEAIPDVTVIKAIADYFGVTVDYILEEEHRDNMMTSRAQARARRRNRFFIVCISTVLVWLVATVAFSVLYALSSSLPAWLMYIYALPVSFIIILVFNCIWGRRRMNYLIVTFLMWTTVLSVYLTVLTVLTMNWWLLFIVAAPMQVILLFLPGISFVKYRTARREEK